MQAPKGSLEAQAGSFEGPAGRFEAKVAKTLRIAAKMRPQGVPWGAAAACRPTPGAMGKPSFSLQNIVNSGVLAILGKRTQRYD